jgi:hypothetical protein
LYARPAATARHRRYDDREVVVGATVFAFLILLLLVAERGSGFVWRGGFEKASFYCPPCDLVYPLGELDDPQTRTCPRGHFVEPVPQGFPFNAFFIAFCAAFVTLGVILIASGHTPGP